MDKKVVLITGASSGMGLKTAIRLIDMGYIVYGGARRLEKMAVIEEKGGRTIALDVTDETSMKNAVDHIISKEGRIDILVNNAGYGSCGTIEDIPMEEVKHQYDVNVFGLGRMTQLVLPYMRERKSGRIVNISSMGGRFTTPFAGWYHSTKYAVESISDALRMELRPYNIDVVLIEPGMIQTDWGVIASNNIRKYSGNGDYGENADRAANYYEARYGRDKHDLSDPDVIARTIVKAINTKRPRTRYLTGKNSRSFTFLKAVMPDKLYQWVTIKSMKLK